ncbi:helix-turn-helix domain-containing protein [Natronorarus salvus]|uniref:helix-turn-helix domain-containing protein n=1 Tax=Natronorarus salvus TaxID=3117733 RepID=UPI002F2606C0
MREFTFEIRYERGADPLMDLFTEYPELRSRAIAGTTGERSVLRVERFSGPAIALELAEELRNDPEVYYAGVTEGGRSVEQRHTVLERTDREVVIYSHLHEPAAALSVYTICRRYLGEGTVFEVRREEGVARWRLLVESEENVGLLYDVLGAKLRQGLEFEMGHVGDPGDWGERIIPAVGLNSEQYVALHAAVEGGYYETPREVTLDELAAELDVPRSTLSYRLRRAEAELAEAFVRST